MSILHVNQIKSYFLREYSDLIDLSDQRQINDQQKESIILTRALAAFAINTFLDVEKDIITPFIVDGFNDNGIDAFYFDESQNILHIVQSKWHNNGNGTITKGDMQNFIVGIKDLFNSNFDRFNNRIKKYQRYLEDAINSSNTKLNLIIAHTGTQDLGEHVLRDLEDFVTETNNPTEVCKVEILDQGLIHKKIAQNSVGNPINLNITLNNWGFFNQPYKAHYGFVDAGQIASWWEEHNPRLFAPNIRMFLGESDVNKELFDTLLNEPEKFYYFNNGVTILCSSFEKTRAGGNRRDSGTFECKGVSVVNGAQTVGSIGQAYQKKPEQVEQASVLVKIISLESCPEDFDREITKATNTQNKIENRDFVSQDHEQARLQSELSIDGVHYSFKKGDIISDKDKGFNFDEATIALACSNPDVTLCVIAKSQIGRLWADTSKTPYKSLFNKSLQGDSLWKLVRLQRIIEDEISILASGKTGRDKMHLIHGNRFFAHHIYKCIEVNSLIRKTIIFDDIQPVIRKELINVFDQTTRLIFNHYEDPMLAYFFKNQSKCKYISDKITCSI